jgi:urease accessory protein
VSAPRRLALTIAALVGSSPAAAHSPGGIISFYAGLIDPLTVPAHLLAVAALGLLAGQQGPARAGVIRLFALALVVGIVLIVAAFAASDANLALLAITAVAGALVAAARRIPRSVTAAVTLALGVALMFDAVPDEIVWQTTLIVLAGTAVGALLAVLFLADLTALLTRPWQRVAVRIAGSWIAAGAILSLAVRLAR